MCGAIALDAEVLRGAHDALTKELLPLAINLHAGGERVFRTEEPLREAEAVLRRVFRQRREETGGIKGDLVFLRKVGAAIEDVRVARLVVSGLLQKPLESELVLNVNVPDVPWDDIRGIVATRLGRRHESEPVIPARDPRGRPVYWIGAAGAGRDVEEGTDFHAVTNRQVSVTPLTVDMTRHAALPLLGRWLSALT